MGEDCNRDDHADSRRGLKRDAHRNAIEQAVNAQYRGDDSSARRAVAVEQQYAVENQIQQKADRGPRQDVRGRVESTAEINGFGQQIEERDADDGAGAEAEHQVQFVAQLQRQQSAR